MAPVPLVPHFSSAVIEGNLSDGYWVESFHFSTQDPVPGIIIT
jgi:hypothetical protein